MLNWIGKQFHGKGGGTFTVLHEIGRGGLGVVYLVQDDAGTQYALKLLGPAEEQEVRVSFEQEIKSTFGLDHPNLLNIHDYGEVESDGQIWLFTVAEYCSDGDYSRTLRAYRQSHRRSKPSFVISYKFFKDWRRFTQRLFTETSSQRMFCV